MPFTVQQPIRTFEGALQTSNNCVVDPPEICPVCQCAIEPKYIASYVVPNANPTTWQHLQLEVVFVCPRRVCQRLFITIYKGAQNNAIQNTPAYWDCEGSFPLTQTTRTFDKIIADLSSRFGTIYNQAHQAEQLGLDQICGPGYWKALEFLMKDYAKRKDATRADEIEEKMQLAACIKEFAGDARVKAMAERATWLGNDETHYVRKWEDKDLKDLKLLIDLTLHWITAELLTEELEKSMPDPKAAKAVT
jgi:hypothetical protein